MSIEATQKVDFIGTDQNGLIVLTISNHLEWSPEHLLLLQEKINSYLAFIESGEIYQSYPQSKGKQFKINVACKFPPTSTAQVFLNKCAGIISQAGFGFSHEVCI